MVVRPASREEVWEAEEVWREMADAGEGFGIDEFDENGCHCRGTFYESDVFVVIDEDGEVAGAALFGPSSLSRTKMTAAGCYTGIKPSYRDAGLGTKLLEYFVTLAKMNKYAVMYIDVLISDRLSFMNTVAKKAGFMNSGSLPKCAYVKNYGLADSLLYYMRFPENVKLMAML